FATGEHELPPPRFSRVSARTGRAETRQNRASSQRMHRDLRLVDILPSRCVRIANSRAKMLPAREMARYVAIAAPVTGLAWGSAGAGRGWGGGSAVGWGEEA